MAELETKTIHSVAKAIRLLDLLAERTKPATLTELYQATGWPKSTIHGLLSTMREAGLIVTTAARSKTDRKTDSPSSAQIFCICGRAIEPMSQALDTAQPYSNRRIPSQ